MTQAIAEKMMQASVRCVARRYWLTSVLTARPEETIHQPIAPCSPPRSNMPSSGSLSLFSSLPAAQKAKNGSANSRPTLLARSRCAHSHQKMPLNWEQRHALVQFPVFGDLLVEVEFLLPLRLVERRDDPVDRLPLGDGKSRMRQPGGAADHHEREYGQHDHAQPDPHPTPIGVDLRPGHIADRGGIQCRHDLCPLRFAVTCPMVRAKTRRSPRFAACRRGRRGEIAGAGPRTGRASSCRCA